MNKLLAALSMLLAMGSASAAVDVNTGSQAELEQLKGIGPDLSQRLLDERAKAPFVDWDDLMKRVPGVKKRQAQRLSEQGLTVGGRGYPGRQEPLRE
jgi:competence protein ComEA